MKFATLKTYIFLIINFLLLVGSQSLLAQTSDNEIGYPFVKNFTHDEYTAHTQNFSIAQDKRGVMYFANFSGVLEYDGVVWNLIQTKNISKVNVLAVSNEGRIFVGARGEIGCLVPDTKNGLIKFKSLNDYLPVNERNFQDVINIYPASAGVYFVTEKSIFWWNNQSMEKIWETEASETILSAFHIGSKFFVMQKNAGLICIENKKISTVKLGNGVSKLLNIQAILEYSKDTLMVASANQGLYTLVDNNIEIFSSAGNQFLQDNTLSCGIIMRNGDFAFGTERAGIIVISPKGKVNQIIDKNSGLQNDNINFLFQDSNSLLWAALNRGIALIDLTSSLSYFNQKNGLNSEVFGLYRHKGELYIYGSSGLFILNKKKFIPVKGIASACWDLKLINNLLLAATSEGVYKVLGSNVERLSSDFTLSLYQSVINPKILYAGKLEELSAFEIVGNNLKELGSLVTTKREIRKMEEDKYGNLWLEIQGSKVFRYSIENKTIEKFDTTALLPELVSYQINKLGNDVIFSTAKGIYKFNYEAKRFNKLRLKIVNEVNEDLIVHSLVEDRDQNLWCNAWDETAVRKYIKNKDGDYEPLHQPFLPIADFITWAIYPDENGIIWFGGPDGLIRYNSAIPRQKTTYSALIRKVRIGQDSLIFHGSFFNSDTVCVSAQNNEFVPVLNFDYNNVAFDFASMYYGVKGVSKFQYFLEGYDKIKSPIWSILPNKEYNNLPEGKYIFHVYAQNIYNEISEVATFKFEILTPISRRWYAYLFYGILLLGIVTLFITYRLKKLKKEKEILENIIEERTKEIVAQKEEIEKQSIELSFKNDELEKINIIVQSINSEIHFTNLLFLILEKMRVVKGMETATILLLDDETNKYKFRAAYGMEITSLENLSLDIDEVRHVYMSNAEEVYEDIFINNSVIFDKRNDALDSIKAPKSLLVIIINIGDKTEGFIVLGNKFRTNAFDTRGLSLTKNLKEHLVSAFIKTKILEDLQGSYDRLSEQNEIIVKQTESITSSIQYARRIQSAVLSSESILDEVLPHFIMFRPRDIVSGDYYWLKRIDSYIYICAADCTGHGVPGAFMSMLGMSLLDEISGKREILSPNLILNDLRFRVKKALKQTGKEGEQKDGMDLALCLLDMDTLKLQYAGANNPLWIIRKNDEATFELKEYKADKMPIGVHDKDNQSFTNHEIQLSKLDAFYIFTDGYEDQFGGEKGRKFLATKMKSLLTTIQDKSMPEQKTFLENTFDTWIGTKHKQIDDVLFMGVRVE